VHLAALAVWTLTFSFLPSLLTGMPLRHLLSSDAEFYVALEATLMDPSLLKADRGFEYARWAKPGLETVLHRGIGQLASVTGTDIWTASIIVSIVSLLAFVSAIYVLAARTLFDKTLAFVVAAISAIPVHALSATTLGFQALGFLPRDLALTVALLVLIAYVEACKRGSGMVWVFVICGISANFYVLVFAHLCATLLVAEVIRVRRVRAHHIAYGALFVAAALPVLVSSLQMIGAATPVDAGIMRMRESYMLAFPLAASLRTTLRRVVIYTVVALPLAVVVRRYGSEVERRSVAIWRPVAVAALVITLAGVVIENTTTLWAYQISRTSLFFLLAAMMMSAVGFQVLCRLVLTSHARRAGLIALAGLLLVQSNLPSVYRNIRDLRASRDERLSLIDAADWLRQHAGHDDRVIIPTTADKDIALTLRAYSLRPLFVTEKDGGVSMLDGDQARKWLRRFTAAQQVFASRDAGGLLALMHSEQITYAVLPRDGGPVRADALKGEVVHGNRRFIIVRVL
jgi:hypothetical protein